MSVVILLSSLPILPVFGYMPGYELTPAVLVSGIASRNIVKYPGTAREKTVFPPSSDQILAAIDTSACLNLAAFAATGDWDRLADAITPAVNKVLADSSCNPDGTTKDNVGINWSYGPVTQYEKNSRFEFCYDWRLDPMDNAKLLSGYIDYVCRSTGHSKVNIVGFSMGSAITMAYIQQFGYDKIAGLVLSAPACNGVKCAGEPYNKMIKINPLAVYRYIETILSGNSKKDIVTAVSAVLYKAGVINIVADFANKLVENCLDRIYSDVMLRTFASMPGMWSLIPDEYYESAKALVFKNAGNCAGLIKRIDNYHYNVQVRNKELIDGALARGINFGIIVKYGKQIAPCIASWDDMTDGVIDTAYASFGAECSALDGTLGKGYVQAVNDGHCHLSADGQIDASTCTYPEQTWFVKDLLHMNSCDDYTSLESFILYSAKQVTVFDDTLYPQFLSYSEASNAVSPLTASDEQPVKLWGIFGAESWVYILARLVRTVWPAINI